VSDQGKSPTGRSEWPNTTSSSLLSGARRRDPSSWQEIAFLYPPLVRWWCRQGFPPWKQNFPPWKRFPELCPVPCQDEQDLVHEVFLTVFKKITTFAKDGKPAAFRRWLYAITRLKVLEYWVGRGLEVDGIGGSGCPFDQVPDEGPPPDSSNEGGLGTDGHNADRFCADGPNGPSLVILLRRLLAMIQPEFKPRTWQAFWLVDAEGRSVNAVADLLCMTRGAVYTAKCKVRTRLKEVAKSHGLFPIEEMLAADSASLAKREETLWR
jgi:RNA polymerase sigma-70 factor (ECF subfamily)